MKLALNKEGMRYILGLALKDDQSLFSQVVLSTDELEWSPPDVGTMGFSSLADAQRAKEELQNYLGESLIIYQMSTRRRVGKHQAR